MNRYDASYILHVFLSIISLTVFFASEKEIEDIGKIFYNTNVVILYIMCVIM